MSVNRLDATEGRRYRCVAVCCPSAYHPTSRQACVPSAADLCIKRATSVDVRIAGCCICAIARDRLPGNRLEYLRLAAAGDDAAAASLPSRRTPGLARASTEITSIGTAQSLSKRQPLSPPLNTPPGNYKSLWPRLGTRNVPTSRLHKRRRISRAILTAAATFFQCHRIGKSISS